MGQHFVMTGNSRLTVEVAGRLAALGGTVVVLDIQGDGAITRRLRLNAPQHDGEERSSVVGACQGRASASITVATAGDDLRKSLAETNLLGATCLLALADDEEENLLVALAGGEVAPDVPVVLQTFDEALADALEQVERDVEVRRAYSVGGLSAPFFVALALGDENIRTMRFGDVALPILCTEVAEDSPLVGSRAPEIRSSYHCEVIARSRKDGSWDVMADDADPISASDMLVVGGPQVHVFTLACENSSRFRRSRRRSRESLRRRLSSRPRPRAVPGSRTRPSSRRRLIAQMPWRRHSRLRQRRMQATRLLFPTIPAFLAVLLLASVSVIALLQHLDLDQGLYVLVKTLLGEPGPDPEKTLDTAVAAVGLLVGWALAGLAISFLAALFVIERLEQSMTVRAKRYENHAIVGGWDPSAIACGSCCTSWAFDVSWWTRHPGASFSRR